MTPTKTIQTAVYSMASPLAGREVENQDNYLLVNAAGQYECLHDEVHTTGQLTCWPTGHHRLAVLDGLGGHGGGRQIAERIVQELLQMPAFFDLALMRAELRNLHARICAELKHAEVSPGSTLLILEIPAHGPALLFHVGDSRLLALRPEGLELLTIDHCPPTAAALRGELDEHAWLTQVLEEDRCEISQAFGLGNTLGSNTLQSELYELTRDNVPAFLAGLADCRPIALEPAVTYLLATDGLWAYESPLPMLLELPGIATQHANNLTEMLDTIAEQHRIKSRQQARTDNTTLLAFALL